MASTDHICSPKPALKERPQLSLEQAAELEDLFKVLANDTRLRLLHALARKGEACVSDLAEAVAMTPQAVSNQLQRMVGQGILRSRRDGNNIYYRVHDPCVTVLLDRALCLVEEARQNRPALSAASAGAA